MTFVTRSAGATAISWGDLATAPRSTGATDVIVHVAMPALASAAMRVIGATSHVPGAMRLLRPVAAALAGRIDGPDQRALSREIGCEFWCRAIDDEGGSVERRMVTPNGYALTADAVVRISEAVLAGRVSPGAHTPSQALGPRFALELDGVDLR